ncbi:hypothetical protein [Streptomyces zingiberis]|uniref:Helix-turn-helix domain-containing protein n=1 Tax=Streptomyces zingiberis TaxID=2053010 RepID=A0ABX1C2P1_9ACTN|nr:hypothetical protein [Streptomyces zingiberis]NJQ02878.1 hypothetical protein [Streptomyces zingiberis]
MADPQSNARLRADAGAPTSGVIHLRSRLTADFTVLSNALAQRRGSAVTIGVAAYILSLPDGAPVSIAALCEHFTEGEILISRALNDLERDGYLERRRERLSTGRIRTRTYVRDVPLGAPGCETGPRGLAGPSRRGRYNKPLAFNGAPLARPVTAGGSPTAAPGTGAAPAGGELVRAGAPEDTGPAEEIGRAGAAERAGRAGEAEGADRLADPRALAVLAALRSADPRLILSRAEAARLAPAVTCWLAAGVSPTRITEHLTAGLPDRLLARPSRILAFRLKESPLLLPARSVHEPASRPVIVPLRNCAGCDRAFRSTEPGRCRDCRSGELHRAAG